jgi:hypothetical protein
MSEEQIVTGDVQAEEAAPTMQEWTFEDLRVMLNQLLHEARLHGLKIDEVLAAVDITAKNLQVQYEMAVVEATNAARQAQFMDNLSDEPTTITTEAEEGC